LHDGVAKISSKSPLKIFYFSLNTRVNTYTQELDMFNKLKKIVIDMEKMRERQRAIRATIKELSALTDKELHDIGISRGEIYDIANRAY
jgi:uncharacterized protein YjiS (DUF1127 family)